MAISTGDKCDNYTVLETPFRVPMTLLLTTHEPPSRVLRFRGDYPYHLDQAPHIGPKPILP